MAQVRFAIVDANPLTCMGIKQLLSEQLPAVRVYTFSSVRQLKEEMHRGFQHYLVSSSIYLEHRDFFRVLGHKVIVMGGRDAVSVEVPTLNVQQDPEAIAADITLLQHKGHAPARRIQDLVLSPRELQIAILLCRGMINKEIADHLELGQTTVITHRKNIMRKLDARSIADILVYLVRHGILNLEDIKKREE